LNSDLNFGKSNNQNVSADLQLSNSGFAKEDCLFVFGIQESSINSSFPLDRPLGYIIALHPNRGNV